MKTMVIQGYEIGKDLAQTLHDDTIYFLAVLRRKGSITFDFDDSTHQLCVVEQLIEISKQDGYFHVFKEKHRCYVISDTKSRLVSFCE